jgi:hypothetical protein
LELIVAIVARGLTLLPVGLGAALASLINQDSLLPPAWRLVGAVNTTRPTAWPLFSFQKFFTASLDPALTRRWLLCVLDPANEFVSTERRQFLPKRKDRWI